MRGPALLLATLLAGCFPNGEWIPTIWGGAAIDDASDPENAGSFVTEDGCDVTLDAFVVSVLGGALLTPEGTASAILPGDQLFDLVQPGPHSMASVFLSRGAYPELAVVVGGADADAVIDVLEGRGRLLGVDNASSDANPIRGNADPAQRDAMETTGAAALVRGTLDCGAGAVALDLLIDDEVGLLRCPIADFEIPGGSFAVTELVARAEVVLAEAAGLLAEDDGDGVLTMDELDEPGLAEGLREALRTAWEADGNACAWESGE